MNNNSCIGLLGLAGNYKKIHLGDLKECLSFITNNFSQIDISTDYGIDNNLIDILKTFDLSKSNTKFIYKVGCHYHEKYDPNDLIIKTSKDINHFGLDRIDCILFHRPSMKKIYSDLEFVEFIKTNYSNLPIGISTNSFEIYQAYKKEMDIKIVQIALNPLDFKFNESFIKQLHKDNVSIQIRSVLSSGLLSGKYNEESIFTDNMRKRYHDKKNYDDYSKRINTSSEIIKYLNNSLNIDLKDIPIFLYSLFEKLPNVQCVVRGGSSLNQIIKNTKSYPINGKVKEDLYNKMKLEWGCEYV